MRLFKISVSLTLLILMFSYSSLAASGSNKGFNSFVAAGANFVFPGSIRVGYNDWEGGLLSPAFVGIDKNFKIGKYTYSNFGLGFTSNDFSSSVGVQAAVGFNFEMFWQIGIRGEIMARALFDGSSIAHGLLGISYGF